MIKLGTVLTYVLQVSFYTMVLPALSYATSSGLDSTNDQLPIAVNGQQAIMITAQDPNANPPLKAGIAASFPLFVNGTITTPDELRLGATGAQPQDSAGNLTGGIVCSAVTEGNVRYNIAFHRMELCTTLDSGATYLWTTIGGAKGKYACTINVPLNNITTTYTFGSGSNIQAVNYSLTGAGGGQAATPAGGGGGGGSTAILKNGALIAVANGGAGGSGSGGQGAIGGSVSGTVSINPNNGSSSGLSSDTITIVLGKGGTGGGGCGWAGVGGVGYAGGGGGSVWNAVSLGGAGGSAVGGVTPVPDPSLSNSNCIENGGNYGATNAGLGLSGRDLCPSPGGQPNVEECVVNQQLSPGYPNAGFGGPSYNNVGALVPAGTPGQAGNFLQWIGTSGGNGGSAGSASINYVSDMPCPSNDSTIL
jgi:hypothetical protein